MPELPEVETVVRTLEKKIQNRIIRNVRVIYPRIVSCPDAEGFSAGLIGQRFIGFDRRGKFLIFRLTDKVLVAHLRMEGKFFVYPGKTEPDKHTHIVFELDDGELHYNDVRKFGRFWLYDNDEEIEAVKDLGCEPFDDKLTPEYLKSYCHGKKEPIKSQLLDQSMIAGIGNIYANEICFEVSMDPEHPSGLISLNKWDEIIKATRKILARAIEAGGTTIRSYTSSLGVTGLFQQELNVQSREKEACYVCGTPIRKIRVGGRGTYYCPVCQKKRAVFAAITGTIGSGKSTVREYIESLGYKAISCDAINADLLKDEKVIADLSAMIGCDSASFSKPVLKEAIFRDARLKKQVEEYLHGEIWQVICRFRQENEGEKIIFVEVPLLFETDWYRRFDCCLLVYSRDETVIRRLRENRGMSGQEAERFVASQMSSDTKKQMADYVIMNENDLDKLFNNVEKTLNTVLKLV